MRTTSIRRLGALATALCALSSAPVSAQVSTTANGPYYATPSWSQKLTTNRFVVLANWNHEAVLDRETGLVWERTPASTTHNWESAWLHCYETTVGNRMGWRLPSVAQLLSLIDFGVPFPGPRLPPGHPFTSVQSLYWSASTTGSPPGTAWTLGTTGDGFYYPRSASFHVWCVRGGSGVEAQ